MPPKPTSLLSLWPVLVALLGAAATASVAMAEARTATQTNARQDEAITSLREASASNRSDHASITTLLQQIDRRLERIEQAQAAPRRP